jgi:hypothetical protein
MPGLLALSIPHAYHFSMCPFSLSLASGHPSFASPVPAVDSHIPHASYHHTIVVLWYPKHTQKLHSRHPCELVLEGEGVRRWCTCRRLTIDYLMCARTSTISMCSASCPRREYCNKIHERVPAPVARSYTRINEHGYYMPFTKY